MAQQQVELLNLPQVLTGFELFRRGSINGVTGESNITANLVSKFSKGVAPRKTGQYIAGISPRFALKTNKVIQAEVRAGAPHSIPVELGTGRRGAATWKKQISGYSHGPKSGTKAHNVFDRAIKAVGPSHRKRIIAAMNKETR